MLKKSWITIWWCSPTHASGAPVRASESGLDRQHISETIATGSFSDINIRLSIYLVSLLSSQWQWFPSLKQQLFISPSTWEPLAADTEDCQQFPSASYRIWVGMKSTHGTLFAGAVSKNSAVAWGLGKRPLYIDFHRYKHDYAPSPDSKKNSIHCNSPHGDVAYIRIN